MIILAPAPSHGRLSIEFFDVVAIEFFDIVDIINIAGARSAPLPRDVLCGWGATYVAGDRKTDRRRRRRMPKGSAQDSNLDLLVNAKLCYHCTSRHFHGVTINSYVVLVHKGIPEGIRLRVTRHLLL